VPAGFRLIPSLPPAFPQDRQISMLTPHYVLSRSSTPSSRVQPPLLLPLRSRVSRRSSSSLSPCSPKQRRRSRVDRAKKRKESLAGGGARVLCSSVYRPTIRSSLSEGADHTYIPVSTYDTLPSPSRDPLGLALCWGASFANLEGGEGEGEGEGEGKITCGDQTPVALSSSPLHVSCTPPSTGCFDSSLSSFPSLLHYRHFTPYSSQHGSVPSHRFRVGGPFVSFSSTASLFCQPSPEPAASFAFHPPALSTGLRLRLTRNSNRRGRLCQKGRVGKLCFAAVV
jgi:hypothetical protein